MLTFRRHLACHGYRVVMPIFRYTLQTSRGSHDDSSSSASSSCGGCLRSRAPERRGAGGGVTARGRFSMIKWYDMPADWMLSQAAV